MLIKSYFALYIEVIDLLRAPCYNKKDKQGIQVKVLSYLLYIKELTISLLLQKLQKAIHLILFALAKTLLLLSKSRILARFLTWCALVI
jgi:hypothetical protein